MYQLKILVSFIATTLMLCNPVIPESVSRSKSNKNVTVRFIMDTNPDGGKTGLGFFISNNKNSDMPSHPTGITMDGLEYYDSTFNETPVMIKVFYYGKVDGEEMKTVVDTHYTEKDTTWNIKSIFE